MDGRSNAVVEIFGSSSAMIASPDPPSPVPVSPPPPAFPAPVTICPSRSSSCFSGSPSCSGVRSLGVTALLLAPSVPSRGPAVGSGPDAGAVSGESSRGLIGYIQAFTLPSFETAQISFPLLENRRLLICRSRKLL